MIVRRKYDPDNLPPLTEEQIKMLDALEQLDDSEIDLSDIPEITEEQFKRFRRVNPNQRKHA